MSVIAHAALDANVTVATAYPAATTLLQVAFNSPAGFVCLRGEASWAVAAGSTGGTLQLDLDGVPVTGRTQNNAVGQAGAAALCTVVALASGDHVARLRLSTGVAGSVVIQAATLPLAVGASLTVEVP